jgi:hypothetical protein
MMNAVSIAGLKYALSAHSASPQPFFAVVLYATPLAFFSFLYLIYLIFTSRVHWPSPPAGALRLIALNFLTAASHLLTSYALSHLTATRVLILVLLDFLLASLALGRLRNMSLYYAAAFFSWAPIVLLWYSSSSSSSAEDAFTPIPMSAMICAGLSRLAVSLRAACTPASSQARSNPFYDSDSLGSGLVATWRTDMLGGYLLIAPAAWFASFYAAESRDFSFEWDTYAALGGMCFMALVRPLLDWTLVSRLPCWMYGAWKQALYLGATYFAVYFLEHESVQWWQGAAIACATWAIGMLVHLAADVEQGSETVRVVPSQHQAENDAVASEKHGSNDNQDVQEKADKADKADKNVKQDTKSPRSPRSPRAASQKTMVHIPHPPATKKPQYDEENPPVSPKTPVPRRLPPLSSGKDQQKDSNNNSSTGNRTPRNPLTQSVPPAQSDVATARKIEPMLLSDSPRRDMAAKDDDDEDEEEGETFDFTREKRAR